MIIHEDRDQKIHYDITHSGRVLVFATDKMNHNKMELDVGVGPTGIGVLARSHSNPVPITVVDVVGGMYTMRANIDLLIYRSGPIYEEYRDACLGRASRPIEQVFADMVAYNKRLRG